MQQQRLSWRTKLAYGAGDIGFSSSYTILSLFFLFFLTDVAGLSPALAGTALLVGKVWDAVIDPYLGHLSDRTVSRWGKRRVFFLYGFLPYGLTFVLLWILPPIQSQVLLFAWVAVTYVMHTTACSVVCVPFTCLSAELTTDYDERTSLTAYRMAFSIIFGLVAAALPPVLIKAFGGGHTGYMGMAAIFGALIAVSPLVPFFFTRERAEPQTKQMDLWRAVRTTFANRAFVIALLVYLCTWVGMDTITAMFLYFLKYCLHMEAQFPVVLLLIFGTAALVLPLWVRVAGRWSKRAAYVAGLGFLAVILTGVAFLTENVKHLVYPMAVLAGIGVSAAHVVPWSILPDVVEDDELRTGYRREGDFFGVMSFIQTLASSGAIFITGWVLELSGYLKDQEQTRTAQMAIRSLIGPVPAVLFFLGMVLLAFYPIDRHTHARIREELDRRSVKLY